MGAARARCGQGAPALFLDRDGTLCELVPYLHEPSRVRLVPGSGTALRAAREAGYRLVVVTNQGGIARGFFTPEDVDAVHAAVQAALAPCGVQIDAFYTCPHHPDFTGACSCRKPQPGLLQRAGRELDLDLQRSYMIGDTIEDVQAGVRAGCKGILVMTGYGADQFASRRESLPAGVTPTPDLAAAVGWLLASEEPTSQR
jgi:D-glycero-D-manno-heptose 1,7-bisphosphate phosphatase